MRRRDRRFVQIVKSELSNGSDIESAGELAVTTLYPHLQSAGAIERKWTQKLRQPDICAAIRDSFEDDADFTFGDGLKKLVEHIRTATDKSPAGSLDALKMYFALTVPKATKKVEVKSMTLSATMKGQDSAPAMVARAIGEAVAETEDERDE